MVPISTCNSMKLMPEVLIYTNTLKCTYHYGGIAKSVHTIVHQIKLYTDNYKNTKKIKDIILH